MSGNLRDFAAYQSFPLFFMMLITIHGTACFCHIRSGGYLCHGEKRTRNLLLVTSGWDAY